MAVEKNITTFQVQSQMGLYEASRCLVVVGRAQRPMHKNSSGDLQYTPDLRNVYIYDYERCICRIFSYYLVPPAVVQQAQQTSNWIRTVLS